MAEAPTSRGSLVPRRKRIIVGITGATGADIGIKVLVALRRMNVETHLVLSKWGEATIRYETSYTPSNVRALAEHAYTNHDMAAPISSGSFHTDGMIIVPCSMKTLAAVHSGYCDDLISRAADVMLKDRRRLVLAVRETPLSEIHLRNMLEVTSWSNHMSLNASVLHQAGDNRRFGGSDGRTHARSFDIDTGEFQRWNGFQEE